MSTEIDKIEKKFAEAYKNIGNNNAELSPDFTTLVMADVRKSKVRKLVKQEKTAWKTGWITFAAAALVMIYFGLTFEQTSLTDDLLSTVYNDDAVSIFGDTNSNF